jgi:hypothetical protein
VVNQQQVKELIFEVCSKLGDRYSSNDAVELVYNTGLVESRYEYIKQIGTGPAKSFWQVEPETAVDNCKNFIANRPELVEKVASILNIDPSNITEPDPIFWDWMLHSNNAAGILHCRIKYWRIQEPIQPGVDGLAYYWKKYYNTEQGAGTEQHFKDIVSKHSN